MPEVGEQAADALDDALVTIVATAAEAVNRAETILREPAQVWLARVDARLAKESWDRTWRAMLDLIDAALPRPNDDPVTDVRHEPVPAISSAEP